MRSVCGATALKAFSISLVGKQLGKASVEAGNLKTIELPQGPRETEPNVATESFDTEDWEAHLSRTLSLEGTNCEDVVVTNSPGNVCDGTYYGEPNENATTLQAPALFLNECSPPESCEDGHILVERKIWMFRDPKCEFEQMEDCPEETVWAVSSIVANATGHAKFGYLQAWANGAIHPVDVDSQWWTLEFSHLDPANLSASVDCVNPDCLIPVAGITIECHPDSPNRTLPPGWTPYPSSTPADIGTLAPFPTPSPAAIEALEKVGNLNGAFQSSPLMSASIAWCAGLVAMGVLKPWWATRLLDM